MLERTGGSYYRKYKFTVLRVVAKSFCGFCATRMNCAGIATATPAPRDHDLPPSARNQKTIKVFYNEVRVIMDALTSCADARVQPRLAFH